jgi:outer membrane usher protein
LTSVNVQRSLPPPGYGYRFDGDTQDPYRSSGAFEVQHRRGVIGVRASGEKDQDADVLVNVAGGVVAIGGEVLLTRPVDDGFALVRVPRSRGVRVMANHDVAGRTSGRGTVFVPDMRSYLANVISINPDDLPVDVRLGPVEQSIAVPYLGGTVVTFQADVIRAFMSMYTDL